MWVIEHKNPLTDEFFQVANSVYQNDPYWLGESTSTIQWQFSDQNPYIKQIKTKSWGFENEARISGFWNPSLQIHGEDVAFFGYFESQNKPDVC